MRRRRSQTIGCGNVRTAREVDESTARDDLHALVGVLAGEPLIATCGHERKGEAG